MKAKHIYLLGFLANLVAAIFSTGHHHCDEYFQIIEFGSYKLGITNPSDLPWEFASQMRSGLQPTLFFLLNKLLYLFSIQNPFTIVFVFRLLHTLLAFFALRWFTKLMVPQIKHPQHQLFFIFLSMLFWALPYFNARHSSENLSTSLFVLGLCFFIGKKIKNNFLHYFIIGFFFGLAFVVRYQAGFMIAGFCLWLLFIKREKIFTLFMLFISIVSAIGLGVLIDKWFYGNWTFTAYNYLNLNILQNKVSDFGIEPWYYFITETLSLAMPPFSILIVFSFIALWMKQSKHFISWITFFYILIHFFVSHKELRFLFPMLVFLPFAFCTLADTIKDQSSPIFNWLKFIFHPAFAKTFIVVNTILLLVFIFKSADDHFNTFKFFYNKYGKYNTIVYYKTHDPYSKASALNYYKSPNIKTTPFNSDSTKTIVKQNHTDKVVFYFEDFMDQDQLSIADKKFTKVYCSLPSWITLFNINNWLSRAYVVTIYEMQ